MPRDVMSGTAAQAFAELLEALRRGAAYGNYERVRQRVLEMRALEAALPHYRPSAYWEEELDNFDYMLDASPLVVDKLRQHTMHITGIRAYEYRSNRDRFRRQFTEKFREMQRIAPKGLLVPESPQLGGYGFDIEGSRYNIDTLKFWEVLIALERGAVLDEFRDARERRLVWEIGAGWGGFPYQFKTLCPNVTYVITDFPELFLYSATYLLTLFPEAKAAFWGEAPTADVLARWAEYDFIFMPNTALTELTPPRIDLTVNMVSFQEMTQDQVDMYVRHAHDCGSRFLYSLNKEHSTYNFEIKSVSAVIDRYYWPRQIDVMPVPYTRMLDAKPTANDYQHIIGWRRVKTQ
jgi:hypothetical protein